jgi:hypothetical protein
LLELSARPNSLFSLSVALVALPIRPSNLVPIPPSRESGNRSYNAAAGIRFPRAVVPLEELT